MAGTGVNWSRFAAPMANVTPGYHLEAKAVNDIVIAIQGVFFPMKSLSYTKSITVDEEWGSGQHHPYNLTTKQIGFSGSFSYASYMMTEDQRHALTFLLENQNDEGLPNWFDIIIMDRIPMGGDPLDAAAADFIEALVYCKITTSGRDYNENATVLTRHDFKAMYRIPR